MFTTALYATYFVGACTYLFTAHYLGFMGPKAVAVLDFTFVATHIIYTMYLLGVAVFNLKNHKKGKLISRPLSDIRKDRRCILHINHAYVFLLCCYLAMLGFLGNALMMFSAYLGTYFTYIFIYEYIHTPKESHHGI